MLKSLSIINFRILKELNINSLGGVNLFVGKNNTGKSTILEALAIYASKGDLNLVYQLMSERGEDFRNTANEALRSNALSLSSLFHNRVISYDKRKAISIGTIGKSSTPNENALLIRFVKFVEELQKNNQGQLIRSRRIVLENEIENTTTNFLIGIEISIGDDFFAFPLDDVNGAVQLRYKVPLIAENFQFIMARNIDNEINGKLWDNITLTDKEQYVIDALKIIEPKTEKINFKGESNKERTAVIKLTNSQVIFPLKSMGDGINRIMTIILAMVNSDNGFLLIDEFENGLHHSVQEQLWSIIFFLSKKLNVQVFATTHSLDCINSFERVLNKPENEKDGKLIRLESKNGVISHVEYTSDELKAATNHNIETR